MAAGRPRSYEKRVNVTTNIEGDLYYFGKDRLGIPAREAITLGYIGRIDSEITVQKNFTAEELDRYFEIRNRIVKDLVLEREHDEEIIQRVSNLADNIRDESRQLILKSESTSNTIDWNTIPEEQKIRAYIQQIFEPDERGIWIRDLVRASDDDQRDAILNDFVKEFASRFSKDRDRPFNKVDAGDIKRVLIAWAEAEEGV
jgi:hypothetical protein